MEMRLDRQSSFSVCSIYGNLQKHNLSSRKQFSSLPKDIDNENIIYPSLVMCYYRTDGLSHFSNGIRLIVRKFSNLERVPWNCTKE